MTLQIKPFRSLRLPSPPWAIRSQQEGVRSKGVSTWLRHCRQFSHNYCGQAQMLMVPTITTAAYSLTTRTLLHIRTHARAKLQYPERHLCSLHSFLGWRFHVSGLLHIQCLTLLCTDGKTSSSPPQAPRTNSPRIEKPPPIDKPRATCGIRFCMFRNLLAYKLTAA